MTAIAEHLNITWDLGRPPLPPIRLNTRAVAMAEEKGFTIERVSLAANEPTVTYPSMRYAGQSRHIRDGVCAVVNLFTHEVVFVYENEPEEY